MPKMKYAKKRAKPDTGVKTKYTPQKARRDTAAFGGNLGAAYIPQKKRKTKKTTPSLTKKARQRRQK